MVRDRLRQALQRLARRAVRGTPRIPGERESHRARPTTRAEWKPEPEPEPEPEVELSATSIRQRIEAGEDVVMVDVREAHELWSGHARGAILAPMSQFQAIAPTLPEDALLAIYCAAGARSWGIADYLRQNGRPNAWSIPEGFPGMMDAGIPWLQPATDTEWKLLQRARLTDAACTARNRSAPCEGVVQSIETGPDGHRISLRTAEGDWLTGLRSAELERSGLR